MGGALIVLLILIAYSAGKTTSDGQLAAVSPPFEQPFTPPVLRGERRFVVTPSAGGGSGGEKQTSVFQKVIRFLSGQSAKGPMAASGGFSRNTLSSSCFYPGGIFPISGYNNGSGIEGIRCDTALQTAEKYEIACQALRKSATDGKNTKNKHSSENKYYSELIKRMCLRAEHYRLAAVNCKAAGCI